MSQIKIIKDGTELVLFPGTQIKFIIKSPLFLYQQAPASRTLSFDVPAEANDALLGFTRLPDNRAKKWSISGFEIWLGGNFWKYARLQIVKITKTKYSVQLAIDKGYVANVSNKSIKDFEVNKLGLPYRFLYGCLERDNYNFALNVASPVYSITINIYVSAVLIRSYTFTYDQSTGILDMTRKAALAINANFETDQIFAHCPDGALEIGYIKGYAVFSTTFSESSADISAVKTSYVSGSLDTQAQYISKLANGTVDDDTIYFAVKNPNYYGDDITVVPSFYRSEWRNPMWPQTPPVTDWFALNATFATGITPFPFLYQLLASLHEELGFKIDDQFFDDELKTLALYSTYDQSTVAKIGGTDVLYTSLFYKLKDTLPDLTFSNFMHAIGLLFCTVFDYNSTTLTSRWLPRKAILAYSEDANWTNLIDVNHEGENEVNTFSIGSEPDSKDKLFGEYLKDLNPVYIKTAVNYFSDLPSSGNEYNEIRLVLAENKYFICKKGTTDTWTFFCENLGNYHQENGTDILSKASTLFSFIQDIGDLAGETYDNVLALFPQAKQTGRSQFGGVPFDNFGLRLLFWRGLVPAADGTPENYTEHASKVYPLGHYHNVDMNLNTLGDYSLAWNATGGLKEVWWQSWLSYISDLEKYEMLVNLSYNDLITLDLLKPKRIKNQLYFIDEIEVTIGSELQLSKVIAYKK